MHAPHNYCQPGCYLQTEVLILTHDRVHAGFTKFVLRAYEDLLACYHDAYFLS